MEEKGIAALGEAEKKYFIDRLSAELVTLRAKSGIAQEELAKMIGVTRQTYGAIERGDKDMSWGTYLSLVFYFDQNIRTSRLLRQTGAFPDELVAFFNQGRKADFIDSIDEKGFPVAEIMRCLDAQGIYAVKTVLMLEYARCNDISGETIIRSFGGSHPTNGVPDDDSDIAGAIRNLKRKETRH